VKTEQCVQTGWVGLGQPGYAQLCLSCVKSRREIDTDTQAEIETERQRGRVFGETVISLDKSSRAAIT
jgi:hypothetical protein